MGVADGIKSLLEVKIKPRQDGYCDQFVRILMLKIMMAGALLTGMNWYSDKIICIMPDATKKELGDFVSSSCWINGLYVYDEIRFHTGGMGYYGIPRDINLDGKFPDGKLCGTTTSAHQKVDNCKAMKKEFFLQYQYMTFLLTALALMYYAPYTVFKVVNEDMASLKKTMQENDAVPIVNNYFDQKVNPRSKLRLRTLGDIIVKILYIFATVGAFVILDGVLNNGFKDYGLKWLDWSKLKNAIAYDYMGKRDAPKPGNELLPSFGFCEVHESAQDIKSIVTNRHRFVCELSQHILYQYLFIIMWFFMVISIAIAVLGLVHLLLGHLLTFVCRLQVAPAGRPVYDKLSLREYQYLEFIRRKNIPLYGAVIVKLKEANSCGIEEEETRGDETAEE